MSFYTKLSIALITAGIILLLLPPHAKADMGPGSPSMDFDIEYQIPKKSIVDIQLFLCNDSYCTDSEEFLPSNGRGAPAILQCTNETKTCWAYAGSLSFKRYHQLVIVFEDQSRESNVFTKIAYGAEYRVIVQENGLEVKEVPPASFIDYFGPLQIFGFVPALILTLFIETGAALLYEMKRKILLSGVGYANMLSLPIVWFIFPFLQANFAIIFILAELFAIIFEAGFLYAANRKKNLSFREVGMASIAMNGASVIVGAGLLLAIFTLINQ